MLTLNVKAKELFDERTSQFINVPNAELHLEHSLISLSRWESKWKKPFLNIEDPTNEEMTDYICCMSIDRTVDPEVIKHLNYEEVMKIREYISDPQTATKIYDRRPGHAGRNKIFTSEEIYYWMIYYGIPFSCEKWPLNRLLTLVRICGIKGGTSTQEMSMNAIFAQNNKLNAARRAGRMNG